MGSFAFGGKDSKYLISTSADGMKLFEWQAKLKPGDTVQRESELHQVVGSEKYLAVTNDENGVEIYSLNELSSKPLHVFDGKDEEGTFHHCFSV